MDIFPNTFVKRSDMYFSLVGWAGGARKTFLEINFENLVGKRDDQPAGRIDAADALKCIIQMTRDHPRVDFIHERVTFIVWDGDVCRGVQTIKGSTVRTQFAAKVLLAMGYRVLEFPASQGKRIEDGLCKIAIDSSVGRSSTQSTVV
jgi:hypothetical protein